VSAARLTPRRKWVALAIAAFADALQLGLSPVFAPGALSLPDDALDVAVAVGLLLTTGFSWRLVLALAIELVPGLALFPSWTAFVATLPAASVKAQALPEKVGNGAPDDR
jgi:hypothetical protein